MLKNASYWNHWFFHLFSELSRLYSPTSLLSLRFYSTCSLCSQYRRLQSEVLEARKSNIWVLISNTANPLQRYQMVLRSRENLTLRVLSKKEQKREISRHLRHHAQHVGMYFQLWNSLETKEFNLDNYWSRQSDWTVRGGSLIRQQGPTFLWRLIGPLTFM